MNKKDLVSRGKQLSFLLRHDKNYKFDEHGYRTVQDLIDNYGYSIEELDDIAKRMIKSVMNTMKTNH